MEPNMALVLQRFEAQLERIAVAVERLQRLGDQVAVEAGEVGPNGEEGPHLRVFETRLTE